MAETATPTAPNLNGKPSLSRMGRQRTGPQSAGTPSGRGHGNGDGDITGGLDVSQGPMGNPANTSSLAHVMGGGGSGGSDAPGLPCAPAGNLTTWRWMLTDDTVAIARAAVMGPMIASRWQSEGAEDDTPQEWVDFIAQVFVGRQSVEPTLKPQILRSMDFGSRSFELVPDLIDFNGRQLIGIKKLKPLRPELTRVLTEKRTGDYAGLKNGKATLAPEETLHVTYDLEDDDYYGRPRLETVRQSAWWPGVYYANAAGRLGRKISNIIPIVHGPLSARDYDEDGNEIRGYDNAQTILDALTYGDGVMVESLLAGIDDLRATPELAKATPWVVESFDTGTSATGLPAMEVLIRLYDSKKMRGMLVPERTALEGQHGTKSEVAEQADVGLAKAESDHAELLRYVNQHLVDRLLVWNFGEKARGQVMLTATPLIDEKKAIFRWVWEALLANPGILDLLAAKLDIAAMAEGLEIPTLDDLNPAMEDAADLAKQASQANVDATAAKAQATLNPPPKPNPPGGGGKPKPGQPGRGGRTAFSMAQARTQSRRFRTHRAVLANAMAQFRKR